ncbi:MAG: hypothetical protein ACK4YP_03175 [Myxococcota bacterium]
MRPSPSVAARVVLEALVVLLAAWQVWTVGAAVAARVGADFDLEWMEGATLITAKRAAEGLPFYTLPQPDYVPFIYPPLYAWVVGGLSHLFPLGYALGRGVSIVCTLVAAALLAVAARREGARWPIALGVAALFIGCWEEGGTFYDLVRIDALALSLTAGALVLGRGEGRASAVASGALLAVAFAAKHNMALLGLPIALWRWRAFGLRDALTFVAASAGPALAFTVAMQAATEGLFLTYLLEVAGDHGMVATRALPNLKGGRVEGAQAELWRALPITTTVGVLTAWAWLRRAPGARANAGAYWGGVMATGLVMVSLMRGHQGGYLNVLIPMFWMLPMLAVLPERALAGDVGWRRWVPHVAALILAAQLWEGRSANLKRYVPTPEDAENAAALVEELRGMPGPVLMPHGPWYPVMAGHAPSFALIALWDVDHEGGPLEKASRVIDRAIAEGHYGTIVTPDDKLGHGLKEHYTRVGMLKARPFGTRTGWGVRFRQVWRPRKDAAP